MVKSVFFKVVCIEYTNTPFPFELSLGAYYDVIKEYLINDKPVYVIMRDEYEIGYFANHFKKLEDVREEKLNKIFKNE